jgi:predicted methyltransferase
MLAACSSSTANLPSSMPASLPAAEATLDLLAPDRSDADKALDPGRKPAEFIAFIGVRPGMKVAELGAGGGYTTELLARAVGPAGKVYAENNETIRGFAGKSWDDRLSKPVNHNVVRVDREFDDPLPPDATNLDVVVNAYLYHDTVWMKTDRDKMNKAIFAALKPGGHYIVADSSAKAGTGVNDVQTLHRIEESVVVDEVKKAGFQLEATGDFLRNPADTRDWSSSPKAAGARRGTSDRFVLKFVKP